MSLDIKKNVNIIRNYDRFKFHLTEQDAFAKGIPYMFITTPKLNLAEDNIRRDNFLIYMRNYYPDLFFSLTTSDITSSSLGSPFIKVLTNSFKGLSGKDLSVRTIDVGETFYGYKQTLPSSIIDSKIGDTVNVKYYEYKDLPIVKMHKVWIEYIENVTRGWFSTSESAYNGRYIDYVSSIYYFLLDRDGETILYWCRYTGVTPASNPYSSLIASQGDSPDIPEISIDYTYSWKDDLDPGILLDFNKVSRLDSDGLKYSDSAAKKSFIPILNEGLQAYNYTENTNFSNALIVKSKRHTTNYLQSDTIFKLKFLNS